MNMADKGHLEGELITDLISTRVYLIQILANAKIGVAKEKELNQSHIRAREGLFRKVKYKQDQPCQNIE